MSVTEQLPTILAALIVFFPVAAVTFRLIRGHRAGKGSCPCGCGGCASAGACHKE